MGGILLACINQIVLDSNQSRSSYEFMESFSPSLSPFVSSFQVSPDIRICVNAVGNDVPYGRQSMQHHKDSLMGKCRPHTTH